jgi:hypothetical protein
MALYRWPTDPPGKKAAHTIPWEKHNKPANTGSVGIGGKPLAPGAWERGDFLAALLKGSTPAPTVSAPDPAPAAPAADYDPPQGAPLAAPPDAAYDDEVAGLGRQRDSTLTGLTQARTAGLLDYGFSEDPATKALAFDPNNPFSKAALLKKNYDTSRRSTGQSMGASGQLYSGAYQNAQDLTNRNQLGAENTLQSSLTSWLAQNTGSAAKAGTDYELGVARADGSRTARAGDSPLYAPTADLPAAPAPVAPVAPTAAAPTAPTLYRWPTDKAGKAPSHTKSWDAHQQALKPASIKAGPGVKATKNTTVKQTKQGKKVTYTTSVKGP